MKILIFGGTTEGRVLAGELAESGAEVTVSVATSIGAEALGNLPGISVLVGRRDAAGMEPLVASFDLCVDATHPYACSASANIRAACEAAGTTLRRVWRRPGDSADALQMRSCREAADFLQGTVGRILLTVGSKELPSFSVLDSARLYVRVLPSVSSIRACEEAGIPHGHILALQGPFTRKLNEALLEQYEIQWLVTKDGGAAGGLEEKIAAARSVGAGVVLIARPSDNGDSLDEVLKAIQEELA